MVVCAGGAVGGGGGRRGSGGFLKKEGNLLIFRRIRLTLLLPDKDPSYRRAGSVFSADDKGDCFLFPKGLIWLVSVCPRTMKYLRAKDKLEVL